MNLHQFRFVREAVRRNLNLTEAAKALFTSQPGVSKAILELEDELGVQIFTRHGKRLKRVTEPGEHVLASIEIILREVENLRRIGDEFSAQNSGTLTIATTHTQARYVLPEPVNELRKLYPKVNISLHQATPQVVAQMLINDQADIGIATESLADYPDLITLPCYDWHHVLIMPPDHPLVHKERITLQDIAKGPLITYHPSFSGRARIDQAFARCDIQPNIVLEAIDSDVIRTYVQLGMGIGLVAQMAVEGELRGDLVVRSVDDFFGANIARVAFKRGAYLRKFVFQFAELISDRLSYEQIKLATSGEKNDYVI